MTFAATSSINAKTGQLLRSSIKRLRPVSSALVEYFKSLATRFLTQIKYCQHLEKNNAFNLRQNVAI